MVNPLNDGLNKPDELSQGFLVQAGSVEPTAATVKVVEFSPAFDVAPTIALTVSESGTGNASITFQGAGSFGFLGTSGIQYNWIAVR